MGINLPKVNESREGPKPLGDEATVVAPHVAVVGRKRPLVAVR